MPNATPPAPPKSREDENADLFDLSRLVSSAPPPAFDDDAPELVIPAAPRAPREISALESVRTAAPPLPAKSFLKSRRFQAAAAFAIGALAAVLVPALNAREPVVVVGPAAIQPESSIPTKAPTTRPAAAPIASPMEAQAPVHVVTEDEALEEGPSEATTVHRAEQSPRGTETEDPEEPAIVAEDEAAEEADVEEATVAEPEEAADAAPAEAPPVDTENASMGDLLDHAVAHLDELALPTHGERAEPEPEPAVEEAPAPAGPSRQDVRSVMEGLRPALLECAANGHGLTHVQLTVTPNGRTRAIRVSGAFAGSPEGSCMARAARTAEFPPYEGDEAVTLRYPYRL